MRAKIKHIIAGTIVLLLVLIPCQYVILKYAVGPYIISSSFWTLGPKYYIKVHTSSEAKVVFIGGHFELIPKLDKTPHFEDFILSKIEADTIFLFRPGALIHNDGFTVETVTPPHWVQDAYDLKLYRINLGTHYGSLFHRIGSNYEVLDSTYFRMTAWGDALFIHTDTRKMEEVKPYDLQIKLFGILPMPIKRLREKRTGV